MRTAFGELWTTRTFEQRYHIFSNETCVVHCCRQILDSFKDWSSVLLRFLLPRDARSAKRGIAIVSRKSVCPPVMWMYRGRVCCVSSKLITQVITRVFAPRSHNIDKSKGKTQKFEWNRGGVAVLNRKPAISLKRGKIGPRLILMTNRKSHTRFRLVPKSTTLVDLAGHYALRFKTHASFGAHHENLNEHRPILSAAKISLNDCSFWQNEVYTDIHGGHLKTRRQTTVGIVENADFQGFRVLRRMPTSWEITHDLEWPWMTILH